MTAGSPKTWTTGLVTAADMNAEVRDQFNYTFGDWSTWTPTFGGLVIGNADVDAQYKKIGRMVTVQVAVVFGSTSSFSGNLTLELPVATASDAVTNQIGPAMFHSPTGGDYQPGICEVAPNDATLFFRATGADNDTTLFRVNNTHPWAWGEDGFIYCTLTYRSAS